MLPASQRLHADRLARLDLDLGLVVHDELLARHGASQVALQREPARGDLTHLRAVHLVAVLPTHLGPIHGDARVAHQVLRASRAAGT